MTSSTNSSNNMKADGLNASVNASDDRGYSSDTRSNHKGPESNGLRPMSARLSFISQLAKEFELRSQVFGDDAKFLVEVKSGQVEASLNPDRELRSDEGALNKLADTHAWGSSGFLLRRLLFGRGTEVPGGPKPLTVVVVETTKSISAGEVRVIHHRDDRETMKALMRKAKEEEKMEATAAQKKNDWVEVSEDVIGGMVVMNTGVGFFETISLLSSFIATGNSRGWKKTIRALLDNLSPVKAVDTATADNVVERLMPYIDHVNAS
ncbi:hypothetical protein COLO4_25346 [Corchorus olitorius]|uniref:Uncharacterized protein n=1 Tax=Corchorus olitorius TaxID=93759 RepID=A0A1R3I3C9_9ROSI|nr:hypothetical protein COLO4_25346 [Corchorus olitorius]